MNDNMPQMKPIEMPKINLDLSTTYNMASTVQRQMDEMNRESMRIAQEAYESRQREIRALEETAANTYETNSQLKTVSGAILSCIKWKDLQEILNIYSICKEQRNLSNHAHVSENDKLIAMNTRQLKVVMEALLGVCS